MDEARWPEAEQQLRHFLLGQPSSAEALYLLGSTLLHENKPTESLATFTQAARLSQPSPLDLRYVSLDYVLLNDYTDADRWITRSVEGDSADGESWYAMGRIKYTENRFVESVASFRNALVRMPRSVKAANNLGLAYEGLNRQEDAIQAYRQALDWQKDDPHPSEQPFLNLGILLTDRNQYDEALRLLQKAEALAPHDGKVHGALGRLHVRRGELPQAQAELEQAVAATPGDFALHYQLGQVYRKEGMLERATAELKQAAAIESKERR